MADPWRELEQALQQQEEQSRRRRLVPRRLDGVHLVEPNGQRLLNFGGNDYLGIVAEPFDPFKKERVADQLGATASALVCGWTEYHEQLAQAIARLEQTEAAVVFPSGFAACSGTLAALASENDLILSDQLNHASLIDGCRWSKATRVVYPHCDMQALETLLREHRKSSAHAWLVTDSVFSMDGDLAPLADIVQLCEQYDAVPIVDEAHATGVLGETGGGLCEALSLQKECPIRIGTLSKSIGHQGGFVAGPQVVIDTLIQKSRPLIYSTALSPFIAASACAVVDQLGRLHDRRQRVAELSESLRETLGQTKSGLSSQVPIIPHIVGHDESALRLSEELKKAGFFVPAIRPPTVPEGTARLRISLSAAHTYEQIDRLAKELMELTRHSEFSQR